MDPAEIRAPRRQAEPDQRGEERGAAGSDRRRDVRAVSRPALHRHQAVRHRGRRVADAGARSDPALSAPSSASRNSCSACRIAAGSTCWPISWASPMPRSSPSSRAMPANPEHVHGSGDVKYHLGTSSDREVGGRTRASVAGGQPVASRSGQPGRARQGARQAAPARRHRAQEGRRHPDARRRRLRRPGARRRVARTVGSARLPHRRHDPHHRQQPDRVYDRPVARALQPLPVRRREGHPGADLPRQRRRSRGGRRGRARRARIPPALQQGRRHRPVLLPPPRPQRGRRAGLHAAVDVPHDRAPPDDAAALRRTARRRGRADRRPRSSGWRASSSPISKPSSRRRRTTGRTRPTGSKAPGPGSNRRPI